MKNLELFAGIGGLSLASEMAGIKTVAFCEKDEFAKSILKKNFSEIPIFDDIFELDKEKLKERGVDVDSIEIISGGFPCQPFSISGKKQGRNDERDLWREMFRVIREIKPTWVVGENVANFANMELKRTIDDLEKEGYETKVYLIPAQGVGAWHKRERVFIVSYSDSNFKRSREKQEQSKRNTTGKCISDSSIMESTRMVGISENAETLRDWSIEPDLDRMANGVPNRVDRLRCLGNAVVPAQAYPIYKAIVSTHNNIKNSIKF